MKTSIQKSCFTALAILVLIAAPTQAMAGDSATVMSVHSKEASAKFKAARGIPSGQPEGGRFAVVKINNGAYGDASFALVYVPPKFTLTEDSVIELDASGVSVLSHPGSATVSRVIYAGPSSIMTRSVGKLSLSWLGLSLAC
jgi:hypothetical protein